LPAQTTTFKFESTEELLFFIRYVAANAVHQYMKDMALGEVTDNSNMALIMARNANIVGFKVLNDIFTSPDIMNIIKKSKQ